MNLFQLVLKQMRQRALGTWLTLLSVTLGMALAVAVLLMLNAGNALFGQTDYGYDVLIGIGKGSPLQLVLNTVYHIDKSPGNIPYWVYSDYINSQSRPPRGSKEFDYHQFVRSAVPIAVGDTYKGRPIIGTPPKMFVSVEGIKDRLDIAIDTENAIRSSLQDKGAAALAEVSRKQQDLHTELVSLEQKIRQTEQATTPFVEHETSGDVSATATTQPAEARQWKYGKPAILDMDAAVTACASASAGLADKNIAAAAKSFSAVMDLLSVVRRAVAFESGPLEYQPSMHFQIADGRVFHAWKFEAVIGSEVAQTTGLKVGSKFQATHGNPRPDEPPDVHDEKWEVVGVMEPTHTAADRGLYIPLLTFYSIAEHGDALDAQAKAREGQNETSAKKKEEHVENYDVVYGDELDPSLPHTREYISLKTPVSQWALSAIMVKSRGGVTGQRLQYHIQNGGIQGDVQAVIPAQVMQSFFDTFFKGSTMVLLIIAFLVSIVAAVGILVSIYNSVAARMREIAILRALGATRRRVLSAICMEAGLIGLFGGILGLIVGHALGGVASSSLQQTVGQGFNWMAVGGYELLYLAVVVVIAVLAGFVPAIKAYRVPVATNLVAV
jgi:hypothetical protein